MKFRYLLFLVGLFFSINLAFSNNCYFEEVVSDCDRLFSSYDILNLDLSDVKDVDVNIYNKRIPSNELLLEKVSVDEINLLNPFLESGEYVIEVIPYDMAGVRRYSERKSYEYIVDLYVPLPPVVNSFLLFNHLQVGVDSYKIKTQFANQKVLVLNANGDEVYDFTTDGMGEYDFVFVDNGFAGGYVEFVVELENGLKSEPTKRYVYYNPAVLNYGGVTSEITLDTTLIDNVNKVTNGRTFTRDFFISGSVQAQDGTIIYVNSQRIPVIDDEFGAFVLLNEGDNSIEIKNGDYSATYEVFYDSSNFLFTNIGLEKIVSGNNFVAEIKTNQDRPFLVYVDGKFIDEVVTVDGEVNLNIDISRSQRDKVVLDLYGYDGAKFSNLVYIDRESPEILSYVHNQIGNSDKLAFKIKDDIAIDLESLSLSIGSLTFNQLDFERRGNYYLVDISDLSDGSYSYTLGVLDYTNKYSEKSGNFRIDSDILYFEDISTLDSDFLNFGNLLIFDSFDDTQLSLVPSKNMAFNHIFLDGKDIVDYRIFFDSSILVNLNLDKSSGTIIFNYTDSSNNNDFIEYEYIVDNLDPEINLDYSYMNVFNRLDVSKFAFVSGSIDDDLLDKDSFKIGGDKVTWFGDYFEFFQNDPSGDLEFSGVDFLNNDIGWTDSFVSDRFREDVRGVRVQSDRNEEVSSDSFEGSLDYSEVTRFGLKGYDGFEFRNNFIKSNDFILPVSQREGIRSFDLEGYDLSGYSFKSLGSKKIGSLSPIVKFNDLGSKLYIESFSTPINSINLSFASCSDEDFFDYYKCYIVDSDLGNVFEIYLENGFTARFGLGDFDLNDRFNEKQVHLFGLDKKVISSTYMIQGNYVAEIGTIISVDGEICGNQDLVSFVCEVDLDIGMNYFNISLGGDIIETVEIERIASNGLGLDLGGVSNTLNFGGVDYYFGDDILEFRGTLSDDSLISLIVDSNEYVMDYYSAGEISFSQNLENHVQGIDTKELEIYVKAEDEFGRQAFSEPFYLIYSKFKDLVVSVIFS